MTKVLIITGSVRKQRAGENILNQVQKELKNYPDLTPQLADLKEINLPFFDSELIPSDENYRPSHPAAQKFSQMVSKADKILILAPEYNHSIPAVLKNAIDWLYREWKDKPIAFIGYGWVGGARSINHLHVVFDNLKTKPITPEANLRFEKEIDLRGNALDDSSAVAINKVLSAL